MSSSITGWNYIISKGFRGSQFAVRCSFAWGSGSWSWKLLSISLQIASVNSVVDAVPPRSCVRTTPVGQHPIQGARGCGAARSRSPMCSSIISPESRSAVGFARFLSAMSGALPCTASNTADVEADVRAGHDAETADEAGAQIRDDVAVQVRQQQHVELLGPHHELHARRVDDALVVGDVGVLARRPSSCSRGTARR